MNIGGGAGRDTAVHESGHAVARVLSIGRVGISTENAIRWIEMDWGTPHCSVFELPLNMPGLKEFGEREGIREGIWPTVEEWRKLFSFMRIDWNGRACGFLRLLPEQRHKQNLQASHSTWSGMMAGAAMTVRKPLRLVKGSA